jgi:hypothetical protein
MPDSIQRRRSSGPRLARLARLALAILVGGILLAGCGGASGTQPTATATNAGRAAGTRAGAPGAARHRSTPRASGRPSALAFARCMRANGVPSFPDPQPGGGFQFAAGSGGPSPSSPAVRAAQAKCRRFLPGGGAGPAFSERSLAEVQKVAVCMRAHGISDFPDPRRAPRGGLPAPPAGVTEVTDYDGVLLEFPATLDMQSPAYKRAAAACGSLAEKLGRGPH